MCKVSRFIICIYIRKTWQIMFTNHSLNPEFVSLSCTFQVKSQIWCLFTHELFVYCLNYQYQGKYLVISSLIIDILTGLLQISRKTFCLRFEKFLSSN